MFYETAIKEFLRRPRVQEALAKNDLDVVYNLINYEWSVDFSSNDLTAYLYSIDVDPLRYVTRVHDYMFLSFDNMIEIHIPSNIKSIGEYAFKDCVELTRVYIDNGLENIDTAAFRNCINLKHISIPSTVKQIEVFAFEKCNFKEMTIQCEENSVAHQLAQDMGLNVQLT